MCIQFQDAMSRGMLRRSFYFLFLAAILSPVVTAQTGGDGVLRDAAARQSLAPTWFCGEQDSLTQQATSDALGKFHFAAVSPEPTP